MRKADSSVAQENQDGDEGGEDDQDDQDGDDDHDEGEEDEDDDEDDYEDDGNKYDDEQEERSQIYNCISLHDIAGNCDTGGSIESKIQILIDIQVESQNKS